MPNAPSTDPVETLSPKVLKSAVSFSKKRSGGTVWGFFRDSSRPPEATVDCFHRLQGLSAGLLDSWTSSTHSRFFRLWFRHFVGKHESLTKFSGNFRFWADLQKFTTLALIFPMAGPIIPRATLPDAVHARIRSKLNGGGISIHASECGHGLSHLRSITLVSSSSVRLYLTSHRALMKHPHHLSAPHGPPPPHTPVEEEWLRMALHKSCKLTIRWAKKRMCASPLTTFLIRPRRHPPTRFLDIP